MDVCALVHTFFLGSRGFCSVFLGAGLEAAGALGVDPLGLAGSFLACAGGWEVPAAGFSVLIDAIVFASSNEYSSHRSKELCMLLP